MKQITIISKAEYKYPAYYSFFYPKVFIAGIINDNNKY